MKWFTSPVSFFNSLDEILHLIITLEFLFCLMEGTKRLSYLKGRAKYFGISGVAETRQRDYISATVHFLHYFSKTSV